MDLSQEEFEIMYSAPIRVDDDNLEAVPDLFNLYRSKMTLCRSVDEMRETCDSFGFLALDALEVLEHIENEQLSHIRKYWRDDAVLDMEEEELFAPLIFPFTMFIARQIAEHELCPQYYAAFNYVHTVMYGNIH